MHKCPSVSAWLTQFTPEERPLAAITLGNLRFVTNDEISHDLTEALMEKVDSIVRSQSKVIIESIIPLEDVRRYLLAKNKEKCAKSEYYPLLYEDYFPAEVRDSDSGSEKLLDVIIRNEYQRARDQFSRARQPNPLIRDKAEIEALKGTSQKIDLILLTDNIGSGKQVIDYLEKIATCCTQGIFSKCLVRVSIIAWTATDLGLDAIASWANTVTVEPTGDINEQKLPISESLHIFHLKRTESFHELSDLESRDPLFQLFQKYGDPKGKKSTEGLGFGKAASRTVLLGSSCPNNVPDFLYTASGKKGYSPLFPGKRIPRDLYDYILSGRHQQSRESKSHGDFEERVRQQGLFTAANRPESHGDASWAILVLAVAGATRNEAILWSNIYYYRFRRAERRLIALGWLTSDFTPTKEGENSVRTYGRKGNHADYASARRFMKRQVDARDIRYYPQSLRGVR
jgi:hypothetical protein